MLKPVLLAPLQREWEQVKQQAEKAWVKVQAEARKGRSRRSDSKARRQFDQILEQFLHRLAHVTVLDPACGSGNFLYVAIHLLLDLEKEVLTYAAEHDLSLIPLVRPTQLFGLEINPYAQQLAQVVVWIGYLQWKYFNGYQPNLDPVLDPFENIRHTDAVLDLSDPDNLKEPEWPAAEFIVGNPPFLGGSKIRSGLGDSYTDVLFKIYATRVPAFADLCCYWFENARKQIEEGKCKRAGLLATQGIRGGASREVLKRIKESGEVFFAESDRNWILDGANVHISMVGFDDGTETSRMLDGRSVTEINPDLTSTVDVTHAEPLQENLNLWFYGSQQKADFDISVELALSMLGDANPHGRPNSDVVKPSLNGKQILRRSPETFVIDFGLEESCERAALYQLPFEYVQKNIYPTRRAHRELRQRRFWWLHARPSPRYRKALKELDRYIVTPAVSKHRIFVWIEHYYLVDHATVVFPRSDDYFFGILHSRLHLVWASAQGTQLEDRPRYTPSTCFETFPFPQATGEQRKRIAEAAAELDRLRNNWLNPSEWTREETLTFPGSVDGPWGRYVTDTDARGIGTVHYRRRVAKDEKAAKELAKRTLTNLYNQMPAWLRQAHQKLDEAVFATYGWATSLSDEEILARLLELNVRRAGATAP